MTKIDRLIKEARGSCEARGHRMRRFTHISNRTCGQTAYSDCLVCDCSVSVIAHPAPNEIEIGGEAVALDCTTA